MANASSSFDQLREWMVKTQLEARGISQPHVLTAFRKVPRHCFVPPSIQAMAYEDTPLPTLCGQTISQPYMVALMTECLQINQKGLKVLEIGTGSGYQAAILVELQAKVISIERIPELLEFARQNLEKTGYLSQVHCVQGDGSIGYLLEAPYDRILVTAAAPSIPQPLIEQLNPCGILVIPVGDRWIQQLKIVKKDLHGRILEEDSIPCRFVPLIGEAGYPEQK